MNSATIPFLIFVAVALIAAIIMVAS